ncbi:MAG: hypothetical protein WCC66_11945 [Rhizobiaceae bacterium]
MMVLKRENAALKPRLRQKPSAEAAGARPGKTREKPGRQALMVLQDEDGFTKNPAILDHGGLNTSILTIGQLAGFQPNRRQIKAAKL